MLWLFSWPGLAWLILSVKWREGCAAHASQPTSQPVESDIQYLLVPTYPCMHAPPERPPNACQRDVMALIGYTADFQIVVTEFSFDVSPTGAPLRALFITVFTYLARDSLYQ
ncbi:uncharacterized protein RSE6_10665 [Rhynchosporium secalis]|uniref:Uncharacterized protein n=1 Tax=Rhynchosporium secalis TaxID=38038 RepID=A0A1E1MM16_RHYSE|nr:uncharacterized protein RSE6_10665 [Rhynchosporium secalis]